MNSEIKHLKEATNIKGCVLTYGHFSTIHPGHIRYLRHAKKLGARLVVALIGDCTSTKYPFNQQERAEALSLLGIADTLVLLKAEEIHEAIKTLHPSVLVLGNDYKDKKSIQNVVNYQKGRGGEVEFHAGEISSATADLLNDTENEIGKKRQYLFHSACSRQNIKYEELINAIQKWENTRLIVLGDTIMDQYAACNALGISAEAPVVVVKEIENKNFIGGAGIVAAHITALGASCDLVSVVGNDNTADLLKKELKRYRIGDYVTIDKSRPTTFKKRYLVDNQKLFRVSRLEDKNINYETEDEVIKNLRFLAPKAQGIVVSDFVYGVITPRVLETVEELANTYNLMLFGDLQCSSQVGNISKFQNFSLLCPNEREARLALKDKESGLEQISQKLLKCTRTKKMVLKLGADGFIAYDINGMNEINSQAFPALCVNPLDVAGAGDSLLALISTNLASGQNMMSSAALACCMTDLAVSTMGNTPITASVLQKRLREVLS